MSRSPERSAAGRAKSAAREARLAAALKRNLGRRKAQAREQAEDAGGKTVPPAASPGPGGAPDED